MKYMSVL